MLLSYLSREMFSFILTRNVPAQAVGWLANKGEKCLKDLKANRRDCQKFWEYISGSRVNDEPPKSLTDYRVGLTLFSSALLYSSLPSTPLPGRSFHGEPFFSQFIS